MRAIDLAPYRGYASRPWAAPTEPLAVPSAVLWERAGRAIDLTPYRGFASRPWAAPTEPFPIPNAVLWDCGSAPCARLT